VILFPQYAGRKITVMPDHRSIRKIFAPSSLTLQERKRVP
jgi:hypothetical protein